MNDEPAPALQVTGRIIWKQNKDMEGRDIGHEILKLRDDYMKLQQDHQRVVEELKELRMMYSAMWYAPGMPGFRQELHEFTRDSSLGNQFSGALHDS